MSRRGALHRAGFAISGWVVLLVMIIFALGIYKAALVWSIPVHTAYAAGRKFGIISAPFVWTGIAALLGWIAYRIAGKSEGAGNAVAGLGLAALATIWSIQVVNYWMYGPTRPTVQAAQTDSSQTARQIAELLKSPTPRVPPAPTAPVTHPNPGPAGPPTVQRASSGPTRAAPSAAPPHPIEQANPAIKATLDSLAQELDGAAGALLLQAELVLDKLDKAPAHSRDAIAQRLKDLASVRSAAKELSDRFHDVKEEAEKKLTAAGIGKTEAFSPSVRFSFDVKAMPRAMACDSYARLCDTAQEECEYLRDNMAKWWNSADGGVMSKDNVIKARGDSYRMRVRAYLREREELASRLRGT